MGSGMDGDRQGKSGKVRERQGEGRIEEAEVSILDSVSYEVQVPILTPPSFRPPGFEFDGRGSATLHLESLP